MHYKIASLILNSGKAPNTINRVFIAQPDALKESLAGRLFVLAEIKGKKIESEKILSFLVNTINSDYYGDEKILLRQKVDTIKVENIFESVLTKTNKSLVDFINEEKIKISQYSADLIVGVVYENKLYFSNLGKNKALLIYPRQDKFAVSNVESGNEEENKSSVPGSIINEPKFFSSVVSGEIPLNSYFIFTNEALPEYLSARELSNIITKLPPIVAAEQIKNTLAAINSYVPFLGIIIKNSYGQDLMESEVYETNVSAHSSISNLNYTEEKTEKMLSPAGLISFKKITRSFSTIIKKIIPAVKPRPQSSLKTSRQEVLAENRSSQNSLPLNTRAPLNLREAYLIKDKIFGRRKTIVIWPHVKDALQNFVLLFSGSAFKQTGSNLKNNFKNLTQHKRGLIIVLGACLLILVSSIIFSRINNKNKADQASYNNLVTQIEEKQGQIDSYLLYGNEEGAKQVFVNLQDLLNSFPQKTKKEKAEFSLLDAKLKVVAAKIQHLVKTDRGQELLNTKNILATSRPENIFFLNQQLFIADSQNHNVYTYDLKSGASSTIAVSNSAQLIKPSNEDNILYYQDGVQLVKIDLKTKKPQILKIDLNSIKANLNDFKLFNSALYVLSSDTSQIYKFSLKGDTFSTPITWLQTPTDLKTATSLTIDGTIYILKTNGTITKLYRNKKQDFNLASIIPAFTSANRLITSAKYFYIFELSSKRLAIFNKGDGSFIGQFDLSAFEALKDIEINETTKEAYVLNDTSVYKLKINY